MDRVLQIHYPVYLSILVKDGKEPIHEIHQAE
jgi:hypothetical protein